MSQSLRRLVLSLVIALALPCALAATERRFVARLALDQVGGPTTPSRCPVPLALVELEGRGRVSRLGRVRAEASHCIVDDPAESGFSEGRLRLFGRRGTLELHYSGSDVAGDLDGAFLIVGGSGELTGASGEGSLSGVADPDAGSGLVLLRGRLRLP